MSNKESPSWTKYRSKLALPDIARPTRQVKPIMAPFLFLMALMRCNVLLMPARLSIAKSPTYNMQFRMHQARFPTINYIKRQYNHAKE